MASKNHEDMIFLDQGKGDVFLLVERLHTWMTETEDGDDFIRPYLLLVIDIASLFILRLEVRSEAPRPHDLLDFLANTFTGTGDTKTDQRTAGFKPRTVIVESTAIAASLKERLTSLGIGVAQSKRSKQIAILVKEFMDSARDSFDDDFTGLVKSTELSVKQAKGFYDAANAYFARSPWSLIADSAILWITVPALKKNFYISVMGQREVQYGLSLFTKPEQVRYFLGKSDVENWKYPRSGLHMLLYCEPPDYSTYDLDYICDHQITIPSMVHLPCPLLFHTKTITYPDRSIILWYEAVLKALPGFIEAHFPVQGTEEPDLVEESVTVETSQGPLEVLIRFPGLDMAQIYPEINLEGSSDRSGMLIGPAEQIPFFNLLWDTGEPQDDRHKAQNLIYDAWEEVEPSRQVALARQALELWSDCADAYNVLADSASNAVQKLALYDQAVQAGHRALGKDFLADQQNIGHFWGILETRPYMRALAGVGQMRIKLRLFAQAEEVIQHMLYLNPGDNQGVRYLLLEIFLEEKRYVEALEFVGRWDDISPDFHYTRALLRFEKKGDYKYARSALRKAFECNPHVPAYLCLRRRTHMNESGRITVGGADEAEDYVQRHFKFWRRIPGSLAWLEVMAIEDAILDPLHFPC